VALKDTGVAELLPSANTIIFDEAHQLPDTATLFFGQSVSTSQVLELCRDVLAEGLAHARGGPDWAKVVTVVEKAARDLRLAFGEGNLRLSLPQIMPTSQFFPALDKLKAELAGMITVLEENAARAETIEACRVRAHDLAAAIDGWKPDAKAPAAEQAVLWAEAFASSLQLHKTPLSIAPIFSNQREGTPRSWIFTSATLAVKNDFKHFSDQLGLTGEPAKTWPSPFDYVNQGLLYVPTGLPEPQAAVYTDAVVDAALPVIKAAGGRTFFLCTTIRAVNKVAERLRVEFAERGWDFPLFVQGERGRTELLDSFRTAGNAVLVGSQSFWEGVDVRGDALSLVIIDKLPFAPPDDPVLAARIEVMEKQGLNGFMHHQLPEAIITLKQGAGRLIRDVDDRGVLMICDPRLITKPYGRRIWQSLPSFKRTRVQEDVLRFFDPAAAEADASDAGTGA
jgi:ATP-dependent DNA helicase DinG